VELILGDIDTSTVNTLYQHANIMAALGRGSKVDSCFKIKILWNMADSISYLVPILNSRNRFPPNNPSKITGSGGKMHLFSNCSRILAKSRLFRKVTLKVVSSEKVGRSGVT
jgi:hypothetical protein